MKNLNLTPDGFLQLILETINTTGNIIDEEYFSEYTEKHPEVWDINKFGDIFYIIIDFLEERVPHSVYGTNELIEDIESYLKEKKA